MEVIKNINLLDFAVIAFLPTTYSLVWMVAIIINLSYRVVKGRQV
jgi:hypothetical protein